MRQLTLGSVDRAVGFYERYGYQGRLLLQFAPPARREEVARSLPASRSWRPSGRTSPAVGATPRINFTVAGRVRGLNGVHAQWVMDKDLNLPAADTRRS